MTDTQHFLLFLGAAMVLAITPGPGIFYVLARTMAGGRREGIQSALGNIFRGIVSRSRGGTGGVGDPGGIGRGVSHGEVRGSSLPRMAWDSHDSHEKRRDARA